MHARIKNSSKRRWLRTGTGVAGLLLALLLPLVVVLAQPSVVQATSVPGADVSQGPPVSDEPDVTVAVQAALSASSASADTLYDTIPTTFPGAFPSLGYAATSTDEFGDYIQLTEAGRTLDTVSVSLTNWSCENDFSLSGGVWTPNRASTDACASTPGSSFDHPITLNIYEVDNTGPNPSVGASIASKTIVGTIPFRPSHDIANCTTPISPATGKSGAKSPADDVPFGGTWYDPVLDRCTHGFAFTLDFDFSADAIVLPQNIIISVAYNTGSHGAAPIGTGGPYDSLNYSLTADPPSAGIDVEEDGVFWDTSFGGFYDDGGAGGTDFFRRDTNWAPYTPVLQLNATACTTVTNSTTGETFCTIQSAIDDPQTLDGHTLNINAGTYVESLNVYKELTLSGADRSTVIIDASTFNDYSIEVTASNVTLEGFTLKGNPTFASAYGIKVAGPSAVFPGTQLNNITIQDVTIDNSKRSGIDLNGVVGATIDNVEVRNVPGGNGIALSDCGDVTAGNITTSNNAWGGFAIYTFGRYFLLGSDNIDIDGTTSSFGEANKVYVQRGNYNSPGTPEPVTNLTVSGFDYTVMNDTFRAEAPDFTFYQRTQADAIAFALALSTPGDSYVNEIATGDFWVGQDLSTTMTIQAAVDNATDGDVINVLAGTYSKNVTLATRVTLQGAGIDTTIIEPSSPGITLLTGGTSAADRLVVRDLTVQNASGGGNTGSGILINEGDATIQHITIENVKSINNSGHGIGISHTGTVGDIKVINSILSGNGGSGFRIPSSITTFDGLMIAGGDISNNLTSGLNINPNPSLTVNIDNISVDGTTFANNATGVGSTNQADLSLIAFEGTINLANIDVTSAGTYGIQIRGRNDGGAPVVTLNNVTVSGAPAKVGLLIQLFDDVSNFGFTDVDLSGVTGAGWYPLAVDHIGTAPLNLGNTTLPVASVPTTISIWNVGDVDATSATFVGAIDNFDIEDHIVHAIDIDAAAGLVTWVANNIYVTVNSFITSPVTTTPSIQRGIDVAADGWTVNVGPGIFTENIVVNKRVEIVGRGSASDPAGNTILRKASNVRVVKLESSGLDSANPVTLRDLRVEPEDVYGLEIHNGTTVQYLAIDNVHIIGTNQSNDTESEVGLKVATDATLQYVAISDSAFDNLTYGWYFAKHGDWGPGSSIVAHVEVSDTSFSNNDAKGIYVEKLSDAHFIGCTVANNGLNSTFYNAKWNGGFDINLKGKEAYANLHFENMSFTANGLGVQEGAALMVKARDDGGTYGAHPATLDNVLIEQSSFNGNERGIRFGEPGSTNAGPTNVVVNNNNITGNIQTYAGAPVGSAYGGLINFSQALVDATLNWWNDASGPSGDGSGSGDTVAEAVGPVSIRPWLTSPYVNGDPVAVTPIVTNLNTNETFCTIQAAIDDVDTLDTHVIEASVGTYEEQVVTSKAVTIQGVDEATTIIKSPANLSTSFATSGTNYPVVLMRDVDGVTLQKLTVDGAGRGNANNRFTGIAFSNASGTIKDVTVKDVREEPLSGNQHGIAIFGYANDGGPHTVSVDNATVVGFQKNGMVFSGVGLTANVANSTVIGAGPFNTTAQNGIQISFGATGSIIDSTVADVSYTGATWSATGILIYDPGADVTVSGSTVQNSQSGIYYYNGGGLIDTNTVTYDATTMGATTYWWGITADPGEGDLPDPSPWPVGLEDAANSARTYVENALTALTTTVSNNMLNGDGNGDGIIGYTYSGETLDVTITDNTVEDFVAAIYLGEEPGADSNSYGQPQFLDQQRPGRHGDHSGRRRRSQHRQRDGRRQQRYLGLQDWYRYRGTATVLEPGHHQRQYGGHQRGGRRHKHDSRQRHHEQWHGRPLPGSAHLHRILLQQHHRQHHGWCKESGRNKDCGRRKLVGHGGRA